MTDKTQELGNAKQSAEREIAKIVALMTSYSFDTNRKTPSELVRQWLETYDIDWIRLATIEALYLGRYKAVSIEQLMSAWTRKGQPNTHFGGDFERLISRKLPRHLSLEKTSESMQSAKNLADSENTNSDRSFSADSIPQRKVISPPFSSSSPESQDIAEQTEELTAKKITTFRPLPDASKFFQKLKAFATNQSQKKQ